MLFNSFVFWVFFFVVICFYARLPHKGKNRLLLVASYIFYGYWDYRFLSLILISTIVDYYVALAIDKSEKTNIKKRLLSISVIANLGMLGFFKYFNFFQSELTSLAATMGINLDVPTLNIILPVGISFYTFQTMSYTIDVYRGHTKPTDKFLDFALYVSFFPQLVAGPIERSGRLLPQILNPRTGQAGDFSEGLYHVLMGLFKKIVIADNMAMIVNTIFSTPTSELTGAEVLIGVYAFAFQIYGDFSGYSSIAQGIAKWMGFDLMWNFKMPYFSRSPSEFWQRWHISLSSWLRDYLYIPLGGNRGGVLYTFRNLVLTMFLGGLWHGAGWTFIIWGLYHGFILIFYRIFMSIKLSLTNSMSKIINLIKIIIFFHVLCISWLIFRADSMQQVTGMLALIVSNFEISDFALFAAGMMLFYVTPLLLFEIWIEISGDLLRLIKSHWLLISAVYSYIILMIIIFPPIRPQTFIYFQF